MINTFKNNSLDYVASLISPKRWRCHCSEISKTILTNINPAPTTDQKNDVLAALLQTGKQIMNHSNFDELFAGRPKTKPLYRRGSKRHPQRQSGSVHFLLAFPDTYEVGMSHLGLQILYSILNEIPYVAAERCFAPWPDREKQLREGKIPLTSSWNHKCRRWILTLSVLHCRMSSLYELIKHAGLRSHTACPHGEKRRTSTDNSLVVPAALTLPRLLILSTFLSSAKEKKL